MGKINSKEHLAEVVAASRSFGQVARTLGYSPAKTGAMPGGVYKFLKGKVADWEIDTSHFVGRNWAKGQSRKTNASIDGQARKLEKPLNEVFCTNSRADNRRVYAELVRSGVGEWCSICTITEWNGQSLRLQVDHINGVNDDNRKKNLRLLCPNCHSQTETYGRGKKRGRG